MNNVVTKSIEVLVVEDSDADADLFAEALRQSGSHCHLNIVADGGEALAFLRREGRYARAPRPKLVILDLSIPGKTGEQVLEEMKHDEQLRSIPVLIFTATQDDRIIRELYHMSAACYVVKPVTLDELTDKIRSINNFWLHRVKLPGMN